jgi:nucleotide-binding universal stress UspA family protein/hemerythrin-like domain-containing protein
MYRHLLVPLDDSALSSENMTSAIRLASSLKAKITFFHATPDFSATQDGALLRSIEPGEFSELQRGETNAVLSKAMVTARHAGVECRSASRISGQPAEAIVQVAQAEGCDLIVMASRGARHSFGSWLFSSQTERVLRSSPVSLLVTRVASTVPLQAQEQALGIIRDEHRSLAVVMQGMRSIVSEAAAEGQMPDCASLERMVAYLRAFPERVHHPKEEQFLHRCLRHRTPSTEAMLAEVEAQHVREHELVARVSSLIGKAKSGDMDAARRLVKDVEQLHKQVFEHIGFEERHVLPLAARELKPEDWEEIAQAFSLNRDPRFGDLPSDEFRRLFTTIANTLA